MKKNFFLLCLVLIGFSLLFAEGEDDPFEYQYFLFPQFMIETLPGAYFYPTFFENFAPDTTFLIEESNGFSFIDPPYVYFEGDSYLHFKWSVNGFRINSALNPGSPSILLPFSSFDRFELKSETPMDKDSGMNFIALLPKKSALRVMITNLWPHMRGFIPGAEFWINPHATIKNRNNVLYSGRRKFVSNYFADVFYNKEINGSYLSLSLNYFEFKRHFNDFSAVNEMFDESGISLLLHSQYLHPIEDGFFKAEAVLNTLERDRAFSELGRLPQETYFKDRLAFFTGFHLQKRALDLKISFTHENDESKPLVMNFQKDLMDTDGDGLLPFEKWGKFSASVLQFQFETPLLSSQKQQLAGIDLFLDFKYTFLKGKEDSSEFNPILFDETPYLVYIWDRGTSFENNNLLGKAGTILSAPISKDISIFTKFVFQVSSLRFHMSENDLTRFSLGFDLGVLLFESRKTKLFLSYARIPYEISENVNFFLETQRPGAAIHHWNDLNQDLLFQKGEEGSIYGYSGGPNHSLDNGLEVPSRNRFLINIWTRLSPKFQLEFKGLYKTINNNLWIDFKEEYGFYETVNGNDLYFFNKPFIDYVLTNESFDENPFYLQLHVHIRGQIPDKWYFSFSFMAHIGMGYTAFGNGPAANDVGVLDESQANPNTWLNGYGRVDGDRAYVAKVYFGLYVFPNFFISTNIKYRDGNPFAFFNSHYAYDQWIITYKTIQAENSRGVKGGPREDYLTDVSIKVTYSLQIFDKEVDLFITMFNLLDFGSELSEYVFSGGWRYANELQIPRSLRAGVVIKL